MKHANIIVGIAIGLANLYCAFFLAKATGSALLNIIAAGLVFSIVIIEFKKLKGKQ